MNNEILHIVKLLQKQVWSNRRLVIGVYIVTSFIFLFLAWQWPRIYTSSSTLLIDQQNILRPLMEGTAVTTSASDRARLAREIVFSQDAKNRILGASDWFNGQSASAIQQFSMFEGIKSRTQFTNVGQNLIRISYSDKNAIRAYETTKLMASIFIEASQIAKQNESRSAYEFIDKQVSVYHEKLKAAEAAIKEFRSKNVDSSPRSLEISNQRVVQLRRQLEDIDLEIGGVKSSLIEREKQLSGESDITSQASMASERRINEQITALKTQLNTLRLTYLDSYPDIVELKGQIARLEEELENEIQNRSGEGNISDRVAEGTFAQTIKSEILNLKANMTTLESRKEQIQILLENELQTMNRINSVEAELSELTRDYDVNQDIYQQLLRQRENAHISMNIDIDNEGLSIKIQEAAFLPVTPEGLRFGHIILAGLIVSFLVPLGIVYLISILDGKVRSDSLISGKLNLNVLASVSQINTLEEEALVKKKALFMVGAIVFVWAVYSYAIWVRLQG